MDNSCLEDKRINGRINDIFNVLMAELIHINNGVVVRTTFCAIFCNVFNQPGF